MMTTLLLSCLLSAAPQSAFLPRARPYDAQHYRLDVRLEDDGAYKNKLTLRLKAVKALTEIELDGYDLKIEMILVDNEAADFKLKYEPATKLGTIAIKPKKPIAAGKEAVVEISYAGKAGAAHMGFFSVTDPETPDALPTYATHLEPMYAQRFFPCNDQPADKATFELFAVVDGRYQVISNGKKEKDETYAEGGKNLRRVHWRQEKAISPYLVALAIGQFEAVEVSPDLPSTLWVLPGRKERTFAASDALKDLVRFQESFTGVKYPWAKLDVVAIPRFFWNGMENASVLFQRDAATVLEHKNEQAGRAAIAGLLSHEIAHQWFGDYVTCKWWDEIWLNEGFATYLGALAADAYLDNEAMEVRSVVGIHDFYFLQERGPRSRPLLGKPGGTPAEAFDSIAYTKGAAVLRMLDHWVGREDFKKSLKAYLEKHALGAASSDDFFKAVFDTTKKQKELQPFKDAWLKKKGYPVIFPETSFEGGKLKVTIRQQPSHADEKGPFVFKLPIVVHRTLEPSFEKAETIVVDKPVVTVAFDVPAGPQWINWNKDGTALVKVNTASISEDQWVDAARNDPDPTWRLLATWVLLGEIGNPDATEERLPTDGALNAIVDVLQKDPSSYVREAVMRHMVATRFKKVPANFSATALALAKRPEALNEDPIGYIRVRRAAMELVGRTENQDGHRYLLDELGKREVDINYLAGFASAAAQINTSAALTTLRGALPVQKARGRPYYRRVVTAFGAFRNPEVVPVLRELTKANAGDNELARDLLDRLGENRPLRETPEFALFLRDLVLDEEAFGEDLRADALGLLDDVKLPAAKDALSAIAAKTASARIKGAAEDTLKANFGVVPGKDDKGKAAPKK